MVVHIYSYVILYSAVPYLVLCIVSYDTLGNAVLGSSNFGEVRDLIWEVRSSYRLFGIALGLLPGDINPIVQSNHYDTVNCFDGVLDEILRRGVTKDELANALESKTLRFGQLAEKVRAMTFSSGM